MTSTERREAIKEAMSFRRYETVENLAAEFDVNIRTIYRDLRIIECSVPIYTVQGNGGGIRVADGWYIGRQYMHDDQAELLRRLKEGLQPDEQKLLQGILDSFAKPKIK